MLSARRASDYSSNTGCSPTYDHAHNGRLVSELYGQRWTVENAVSVIQRRFGSAIRPSAFYGEFRELVLTTTVYNLEQALKQ